MNTITIYGRPDCPWCVKACALLEANRYHFTYVDAEFDTMNKNDFIKRTRNAKTVPQILVGDFLVGGYQALELNIRAGIFQQLVGGQ